MIRLRRAVTPNDEWVEELTDDLALVPPMPEHAVDRYCDQHDPRLTERGQPPAARFPRYRGADKMRDTPLTPAELDVLEAYSHGGRRATIGLWLHKSPFTVQEQTRSARHKLNVRTTTEAVGAAIRQGLID